MAPSLSQTRAANADVRQIVSDMGTELAIADYPDVLSACLMSKSRFCDQLAIQAQPPVTQGILALPPAATYLYPLALVVPGTQHILDNALREVLQVLPFWIQWQAQAKTVCQWLARRGHREFLQERCAAAESGTEAHHAALGKTPERFAAWRWQTLAAVTRDLEGLESAVRTAMETISGAGELGTRDADVARAFLSAVSDPVFWNRGRGLRRLTRPVRKLSGWAKGL